LPPDERPQTDHALRDAKSCLVVYIQAERRQQREMNESIAIQKGCSACVPFDLHAHGFALTIAQIEAHPRCSFGLDTLEKRVGAPAKTADATDD
jgi:hypothetical protein